MPRPADRRLTGADSAEESQTDSQITVSQGGGYARVALASALLVAAGAGAGAAVALRAAPAEQRAEAPDAVSLQGDMSDLNIQYRTGCSNWESLLMAPVGAARGARNQLECFNACKNTIGCVQANFQTSNCQTNNADQGFLSHQCNLYRGQCNGEPNPCWDLMSMRVPTASRTGCSNFMEAQIGLPQVTSSLLECTSACGNTQGCVAVNYQPGPCSGQEMIGQGACYLFKEACQRVYNPCWDLYEITWNHQMPNAVNTNTNTNNVAAINTASTQTANTNINAGVSYQCITDKNKWPSSSAADDWKKYCDMTGTKAWAMNSKCNYGYADSTDKALEVCKGYSGTECAVFDTDDKTQCK